MNYENNILYRNHEAINTSLFPYILVYNDTTATLSLNQQQKLDKEKTILEKFVSLPSVRKLFNVNEVDIIPPTQYAAVLESAKAEMTEKKLPLEILNYVYSSQEDGDMGIYMLPNNVLPMVSTLTLKNAKNSYIYNGNSSIEQQRWNLVEKYEQKISELKECKDEAFVAKQLEPLQKDLVAFDKKNKEAMKAMKNQERKFDQFLSTVGLKEEFDALESTQQIKVETKTKKYK